MYKTIKMINDIKTFFLTISEIENNPFNIKFSLPVVHLKHVNGEKIFYLKNIKVFMFLIKVKHTGS